MRFLKRVFRREHRCDTRLLSHRHTDQGVIVVAECKGCGKVVEIVVTAVTPHFGQIRTRVLESVADSEVWE